MPNTNNTGDHGDGAAASLPEPDLPYLNDRLREHAATIRLGKGTLALFLVVTEHTRDLGLPLEKRRLLAEGGGQVLRLGRPAVQRILARHGISEVLAREGGRTTQSSVPKMYDYVDFLNRLHRAGQFDPEAIEAFWIARVREFLARRRASRPPPSARPRPRMRLTLDPARSLRSVFGELIEQARERNEIGSSEYADAVLNHLFVAAFESLRPPGAPELRRGPPNPADGERTRPVLGDTVFHVTAWASEKELVACRASLERGRQPVLIGLSSWAASVAEDPEPHGLPAQVEVIDIEQVLAHHLLSWSGYRADRLPAALWRLVRRYNEIVEREETDPSLQIRFRRAPRSSPA